MTSTSPELKNLRDILPLERESLGEPSLLDRLTDAVTRAATGASFIVIHLIWFIVLRAQSRITLQADGRASSGRHPADLPAEWPPKRLASRHGEAQ